MSCAVCEEPPFIFIHIPKTGGTSLMSRRAKTGKKIPNLTLMGGHKYIRFLAKNYDLSKYFKFSIIRNPYDRFISLWRVRTACNGTLQSFIDRIKSRKEPWYPLSQQCCWICDRGKKELMVDHLIRFENYAAGVKEVFKQLNLPQFELPHLRRTNRKPNYRRYYSCTKQIDFVTKLYKDDLRLFNYSF